MIESNVHLNILILPICHQQINFDKFNFKVYYFLLTKESLGITIVQSIIVLLEHFRGVFRTLANIPVKGGSFCETSERLKAINFFRKTLLHLRYLTGLWKSLCMELFDCYTPFSKIVIELFDAAISNSFHDKQNKAAPWLHTNT